MTFEPALCCTDTHTLSYLAYALRRAGHGVVHAVVLADCPPQFGVGAVLFQRVGAFVPEVVVDRRVPHRAVVHIDLPCQVLERPGGRNTETRVRSCCWRRHGNWFWFVTCQLPSINVPDFTQPNSVIFSEYLKTKFHILFIYLTVQLYFLHTWWSKYIMLNPFYFVFVSNCRILRYLFKISEPHNVCHICDCTTLLLFRLKTSLLVIGL